MPDIYVNQTVTGSRNYVTGTGDIHIHHEISPAEAKERHDLLVLLNNVRRSWIKGVFDRSLHSEVGLELGTVEEPEAVVHPMADIMDIPKLLPRQPIIDIFNEAERALLILGEPGSGKTFTMLELARDLLNRAETDPLQPIPVIFNLSTWGERQLPLAEWLIGELNSKYRIRKDIGRSWLNRNYLMLLLDGLDEVRADARADCVKVINAYCSECGLSGVVVCSRVEEYMYLPVRLQLNRAVCLQPLTLHQIDDYMIGGGPRLAVLRGVLHSDQALQKLAQTPLMLDVMSLAYRDQPVEALLSGVKGTDETTRIESLRRLIFDTYIERMFLGKGKRILRAKYSKEETIEGLSWLARQMAMRRQATLLIEQLQPNWLATRAQRLTYVFVSRLLGGLMLGLVLGLTLGLTLGVGGGLVTAVDDLISGAMFGLLFGLAGGIVAGGIDAVRFDQVGRSFESERTKHGPHVMRSNRTMVVDVTVYVLVLSLIGALLILLIEGPQIKFSIGLMFGAVMGLVFGTLFGIKNKTRDMSGDIETVEALNWSWTAARKFGVRGILIGAVAGIVLSFISGLFAHVIDLILGLILGILAMLIGGLVGGLIGSIFGGLRSSIIERKTRPNEGIKLSIRNAVFGGLRIGVVFWLVVGLVSIPSLGLVGGLLNGLISGIFFGLLASMYYGGLNVIQHYTLRMMLYYLKYTPRNYVHFLDWATQLVFMRRVGGGYIFIHRLMLEHFASLDERTSDVDEAPQEVLVSNLVGNKKAPVLMSA